MLTLTDFQTIRLYSWLRLLNRSCVSPREICERDCEFIVANHGPKSTLMVRYRNIKMDITDHSGSW